MVRQAPSRWALPGARLILSSAEMLLWCLFLVWSFSVRPPRLPTARIFVRAPRGLPSLALLTVPNARACGLWRRRPGRDLWQTCRPLIRRPSGRAASLRCHPPAAGRAASGCPVFPRRPTLRNLCGLAWRRRPAPSPVRIHLNGRQSSKEGTLTLAATSQSSLWMTLTICRLRGLHSGLMCRVLVVFCWSGLVNTLPSLPDMILRPLPPRMGSSCSVMCAAGLWLFGRLRTWHRVGCLQMKRWLHPSPCT